MKRKKCKLCKVKRKLWETENFFCVRCKKHFVPLIVLKNHRNTITQKETDELYKICNEKYPKLFLDDSIIDSDDHWHIHLSKKKKNIKL